MEDFELLTLILSALEWQQKNGTIQMITDDEGADFFIRNGLEDLWTLPIDTTLNAVGNDIDPFLFWAAGKLRALDSVDCPCVMLDTDLIIWSDLEHVLASETVVACHTESLSWSVYPDPSVFNLCDGYEFPQAWDFSLDPVNTAFLYIADDLLKDYYIQSAYEFMLSLEPTQLNPAQSMCFAEQRILPMCAGARGYRVATLLDIEQAYQQNLVTHVWGYKQYLNGSEDARRSFCVDCVTRILADFPDAATLVEHNPMFTGYLKDAAAETS